MPCVSSIQLEFTGKRLAATRSIQLALSELACAPHYDSRGARSKKETRCGANGVNSFVAEASVIGSAPDARAASTLCNQCDARAVPVAYQRSIGAGGRAAEQSISLRPSYRGARYIHTRRALEIAVRPSAVARLFSASQAAPRWEKAAGEM
jgi:hypothetical protein